MEELGLPHITQRNYAPQQADLLPLHEVFSELRRGGRHLKAAPIRVNAKSAYFFDLPTANSYQLLLP